MTAPTQTRQSPGLLKMLEAFPDAYERGNGWYANDDNPRFDFQETESGYIKIHSWTGRSREDILRIGGLTDRDLHSKGYRSTKTYDSLDMVTLAQAKMVYHRFLFSLGIGDGYNYHGRRVVKIPYHLPDGTEHTKIKVRKAINGTGNQKHCWDEGTPGVIIPYGLDKLDMAREAGYLSIGEGESDAWASWFHGLPYLGIPGADQAKCLERYTDLHGIPRIYIYEEPDQAKKLQYQGEGFYKSVYLKLRQIQYQGEIFCIPFEQITGCKDVSELYIKLQAWLPENKQRFLDEMEQARQQAIPAGDKEEDTPDDAPVITDDLICSFSDDDAGNGDAMNLLYGHKFLYCAPLGWLYSVGTHWQVDTDGAEIKKCAIETLRTRRIAAVRLEKEPIVKCTKADERRVNGCVNLFKVHVSVGIEVFDNDPDKLNCNNGVIDLRTGMLEPHNERQRFTYVVPVRYNPLADTSIWLDFMRGVLPASDEVLDYTQQAVGYSFTGHTREEILFYLYGPTRSGKGTFAETLMRLLPHPLSVMVDFNSFTAKREGDVSNFDLAPLKPSRLIFASESNRSQSLNPAKIKQLTGGDHVTCSFKHKDFFSYRPQFKVWMMSNHPVNGDPDDDALWGRVRVIEFPHSFLGNEDKSKKARLKEPDVLEGVLAWAVEGAMKWYALGAKGLTTPDVVVKATKSHRDELDYVQQWLDEVGNNETEETGTLWTSNTVVTASYLAWCENNNVQHRGSKALAQSLKAKGYRVSESLYIPEEKKMKRGVGGLYIPSF